MKFIFLVTAILFLSPSLRGDDRQQGGHSRGFGNMGGGMGGYSGGFGGGGMGGMNGMGGMGMGGMGGMGMMGGMGGMGMMGMGGMGGGAGRGADSGEKRNGSQKAGEEARKGLEKSAQEFSQNTQKITEGFTNMVKNMPSDDISKYIDALKEEKDSSSSSEEVDEEGRTSVQALVDGIVKDIQTNAELQIQGMQQVVATAMAAKQQAAASTAKPTIAEMLQSMPSARKSNPIAEAMAAERPKEHAGGAAGLDAIADGGSHPGGEVRGFATGRRVYNPPPKASHIR